LLGRPCQRYRWNLRADPSSVACLREHICHTGGGVELTSKQVRAEWNASAHATHRCGSWTQAAVSSVSTDQDRLGIKHGRGCGLDTKIHVPLQGYHQMNEGLANVSRKQIYG
jgi:hypothetical protein